MSWSWILALCWLLEQAGRGAEAVDADQLGAEQGVFLLLPLLPAWSCFLCSSPGQGLLRRVAMGGDGGGCSQG